MGGQLTIKAPNAKMPRVDENSPLEDRINYVLYNEVNPALAAHGGEVSLVEVTEDDFAVLRFGGGCQGCSAVDITLKDGVERTWSSPKIFHHISPQRSKVLRNLSVKAKSIFRGAARSPSPPPDRR